MATQSYLNTLVRGGRTKIGGRGTAPGGAVHGAEMPLQGILNW